MADKKQCKECGGLIYWRTPHPHQEERDHYAEILKRNGGYPSLMRIVRSPEQLERDKKRREHLRRLHKAYMMTLYGGRVITARKSGKAKALEDTQKAELAKINKGKIPCTCYKNSKKKPCLVHGRR